MRPVPLKRKGRIPIVAKRSFYRKEVLPNGVIVLTERMPHVKSVTIGFWVKVGSRDEGSAQAGVSHLIEHMLFKGTERRSAEEIAKAIDSVGGTLDAFTGRENTCFFAKVLGEHLPLAVDLLSDILLHSVFDSADIEKERQVILQEIKMVEDSPDDLVHDLFAETIWGNHPLARPVLGKKETLLSIGRSEILAYLRDFYQPDCLIVSAAGDLEHNRVVELLLDSLEGWKGESRSPNSSRPIARYRAYNAERESAQLHLCLGVESLPYAHQERYCLHLLNAVLGGSVSSRLFQGIREKRGLAYSIYSYQSSFRDSGLLVVYAGINPESYGEVVDLIRAELHRVATEPIEAEEFRKAQEQLKGNLLLGLESTSSRMTRLAKMEIYFGRIYDLDEILKGIEAVTPA
ncbi:MAG: insulinase family protein, partial [candidate division NC10 bacterium]|nr:insulinase family protein [candidate division NC10 bacterium]